MLTRGMYIIFNIKVRTNLATKCVFYIYSGIGDGIASETDCVHICHAQASADDYIRDCEGSHSDVSPPARHSACHYWTSRTLRHKNVGLWL